MRLTREFILGSRLTVLLPPLLLYDEYTLNPKPRKEEWGVCEVCCSRGEGGGGLAGGGGGAAAAAAVVVVINVDKLEGKALHWATLTKLIRCKQI